MEKRARKLVIASRLFSFLLSNALVAIMAAGAFAQAPATLTGVVHDSAGKPVADAEVILRDANRATRTNDWRFYQPQCKPIGVLDHPMYFVVWLKKK